mmetsp:Transcript_28541/g.43158  ORF Transcript_28541/g.43158 Transcript_28541/m.43158 type:complete len:89 (+) Transcript_28541:725-991(+)
MESDSNVFVPMGKSMPAPDFFPEPPSHILDFVDVPEPALIKERQRNDDDEEVEIQDPTIEFFRAQGKAKIREVKEVMRQGSKRESQED